MQLLQRLLTLTLLQVSFPGSVSQIWSVYMPRSIQALKGSCVVIPCTFNHDRPRNASAGFHVVWYLKRLNSYLEVFNSRSPAKVGGAFQRHIVLAGDITKKRCSLEIKNVTAEDKAVYYASIDPETNSYQPQNVSTQLEISDVPEDLSLNNPESISEGKSVNISCSAVHTCPSNPPKLSWNEFKSKSSISYEHLQGGKWRTVTTLMYSSSYRDHKKALQCKATYPNGKSLEKSITLNIYYPPKRTTASVIGNLTFREGDSVTLKCSSQANPTVTSYSWYQEHQQEALQDQRQEITLQNLTWDSGPYYCKAQNSKGTGYSLPLMLNILYAPKETHLVLLEKYPIYEGDSLMLRCESNKSNPAVSHYSWYKAGGLMVNQSQEILQIQSMTAQDTGMYHCAAHNIIGSTSSIPVVIKLTNDLSELNLPMLIGGVVGSLFLMLLGLIIFIFISTSKHMKKHTAVRTRPAFRRHSESTSSQVGLVLFYRRRKTGSAAVPDSVTYVKGLDDLAVSDVKPSDDTDSPYTALDLKAISSDYAELKIDTRSKESKEPIYQNLKRLSAAPDSEDMKENSAATQRNISQSRAET